MLRLFEEEKLLFNVFAALLPRRLLLVLRPFAASRRGIVLGSVPICFVQIEGLVLLSRFRCWRRGLLIRALILRFLVAVLVFRGRDVVNVA